MRFEKPSISYAVAQNICQCFKNNLNDSTVLNTGDTYTYANE